MGLCCKTQSPAGSKARPLCTERAAPAPTLLHHPAAPPCPVPARPAASPLGVPGVAVLDELKGLDGAKGTQQLAALLVGEVVGQAAHKHALGGVCAARRAGLRRVSESKVEKSKSNRRGQGGGE